MGHATRYLDARPAPAACTRELPIRGGSEEAALMGAYIAAGAVALLVTVYLFVALLFPERF
ncbi:MAG: potassium-transporting ATPase subunit F [Candidatus Dormibacteraeota bacterium]|nr:potassium-transporting ATPase subunit F [Candidatus Dormibacteraeota bacterium]